MFSFMQFLVCVKIKSGIIYYITSTIITLILGCKFLSTYTGIFWEQYGSHRLERFLVRCV